MYILNTLVGIAEESPKDYFCFGGWPTIRLKTCIFSLL